MNVIERIIDILKQYPEVRYEFRSDAIRALAADASGYEVALLMQPQPCYDASGVTETQFYLPDTFSKEESAIKAAIQAGRQKIDVRSGRGSVVMNG